MIKVVIACILGMVVSTYATCPPHKIDSEPDKILQKRDWVLKIWITSKGTRSEGRVTRLYHDGKEICPKEEEEQISTPLGVLIYQDPQYLWGWHGWKPKSSRMPIIGP